MPYINIEVNLDDIYDELGDREKKTLSNWLIEDNIITTLSNSPTDNSLGLINDEFVTVCNKLAQSYYRMSKEDEELVIKIMDKYN